MKLVGWLGVALVVTFMVGAVIFVFPGAVSGVSSFLTPNGGNPHQPEPTWSSGNLCSSISYPGPGDITCVSLQSDSSVPLWWNFSEVPAETEHGTITVVIYGSSDCINMNFHSFYSAIVIDLKGSDYSCLPFAAGLPAGTTAGVNIVVNSEGDSIAVVQEGSFYALNITSYGTTTFPSIVQWGAELNTTVTYIGTTPGFASCPSGITVGRVAWSEVAFGYHDTFNTIFVDGPVHMAPTNYGYSTEPLQPPDGNANGVGDLYGNETTQTAPAGSCAYLGV